MNVQKGKPLNQHILQPGHYPNQQPVSSTPFNHNFDGDASQKYPFGASYVGGTGVPVAGTVPTRLPLATPLSGPNPPIATPPTGPNTVGGMPQGPPPGSFVAHGIDLSKQTPPLHQSAHQSAHHPLPPGGLAVSQQIPMANAGHGPMQGRPTQGNNQFANRYPMRGPGNLARPSMPGSAINPNHPPNTPSMPYPNASPGLNQQQVLFVIGDGFNGQPYIPYIPPYYPPGGTMPPAGVAFNPPRAAQQPYGFRPAAPYQYPIQSSPAVYYQQQQQPPQQPQQQQQQQQQQPQQPQAVPVVAASAAVPQQPRESGSSQRRQRSSALRIVDPSTNRDVLTGEEVPPTAATPPISASTTEETASPAATPAPASTTVVPTPSAVTTTTPSTQVEAPIVEESPTPVAASAVPVEPVVEKAAAVDVKSESQVATVADEAPPAVIPAVEEAATLVPAPAAATSAPAQSEAVVDEVKSTPAPAAVDRPASTTSEKETSISLTRENGLPSELPSSSEPPSSSASPTPVSTPTSPETGDGRGTQKRKPGRKTSRQGTIPARPDAEEAQVVATVPTSTAEQKSRDPSSEKEGSVNTIVVESTREVEVKETKITQQQSAVPKVEDKSSVGPSEPAEPAAVVTNGDPQPSSTALSTMTPESETTPPSAVTDDGEAQIRSNPSGLQYKEDQWSPHNPEGKKAYDRTFLLMLQKNPASQRKPEGLPNLEVVRDKSVTSSKRPLDFTPPFLKLGSTPGKSIPKRSSQQGSQRGGGDQQGQGMGQAPRKEIRLQTSIARMERVEDPNVWKPKHAVKSKEDDPDKMKTDELLKTVRGILNKLTPSKFDKLLARIQSLNIDSEDRLAGVIKLFFEKAVDEPIFSSTYAKMCHALSNKEVASSANPSETTNFRKLLLTRCQREFEKDSASLLDVENKKKEIETAEVDKKKELEDELDDLVNKNRRRSLGNIRFIGELFKLRILSVKIMHQCIIRLLKDDDEESLECLCRLLSTIGKELETPMQPTGPRSSVSQSRDTMNGYFSQLEAIVKQRKTSNRIRFMIQDVMDLRRNQWKPRREDNNPKTIEQIHKDAERERTEQEQELMNAPNYPGQMGQSSRDRPGDRRDRDDRNRKTSRGGAGEDGWTISGSRSNAKVDMKQLRIPRLAQAGDADQQGTVMLGPAGRGMGHSWGRGASGGMSTSITPDSSNVGSGGGRSNRYQLLEDDSGTHGNIPDKAPFGGRSSLGGPPSRSHQEYRPMSGATKSAFFPPKDSERERCLDAVRSQNSGPLGRSRSQQSSRESSVTRPVKEATQPPPISREPVKEPLLGKPGLTDDGIERKVNSLLGEYFSNGIMEDVVLDLKESLHSSNVPKFVNFCLMHVLEHDQVQRKGTGTIFKEMIKRRYFSADDILEGFTEVLQSAEDFLVDIPKLWEYLAEIVDPLFSDSVVPLTFLRPLSASVNKSLAANFVAAIIKELVKTQGGESAVGRMWSATNLQLSSLLLEVDPVAFAEQNKIRFLLDLESSSTPSGADKTASSSGSTPAHTNYSDFQAKLERYLKGAGRSTEEVCMWIQQNTNGDINPSFIRALVTAVTESCIDGIGTDSKLNNTALKNLSEVLRKYVDNAADLELQSLFAVQALVTHRQHPKGLIQGIFEMLYDSNVVSEDGFETWVNTDDPSEREGKAVALKSLTSFLTWLKEADPESDQDAEAP